MQSDYLLGFDLGSSALRALLLEPSSGKITYVTRPWSHPAAPQFGPMAFDFDTSLAWRALAESVEEVLQKANATARQVIGLAVSGFRYGAVVIDRKGEVLLSTTNRDARAAEQAITLAAERSEELYSLTGRAPIPICLAARLLWLKENNPSAYKNAFAALSISDWVAYQLSGVIASDLSQAGESLLFDIKKCAWQSEITHALGLRENILPRLKNTGARIGTLTKEAARHLGLLAGTPIAVGGGDTQCALLGMGAVNAGQWGIVAGTTTPIQRVCDQALLDAEMRLWTGLHLIPGLYVLESNAGQTGASLERFAQMIYPHAANPVANLCAEAAISPPGAHGLHSTLGATIFHASSMSLPVDNLTYSALLLRPGEGGRSDLARALLEGMAYGVRANLEQIASVANGMPEEVFLGGGLSQSELWARILSDVLGSRVRISARFEASALGAALCAGVAAGLYPDVQTASQSLKRSTLEILPSEASTAYQSLYADWQAMRLERRAADRLAAEAFTQNLLTSAPIILRRPGEFPSAPPSFRPRIYISAEVDDLALQQLRRMGEIIYRPYRSEGILLTGDHLIETIKHHHVFVTEVDLLDAEALLQLPHLRMVIACRGNPVNIDIHACTAAGVLVVNTPGRNADAVADLTMGFMLMLARKLQPAAQFLRTPGGEAGDMGRMGQAHEEFLGCELWRKTIGMIGAGAVGKKVIQRLLPFGTHVYVYDPYLSAEEAMRLGAEKVPLERVLTESDFISLHAPLTEETREMLNADAFAQMKRGVFLINTARAALVNQEALLAALRNGTLGGYATDVFPVEPPSADDPLLAFPNVIATPHIGGNTREVAAHQGEMVVHALQSALEGIPPLHLLNPEVIERFDWSSRRKADVEALKQHAQSAKPGVTDLEVSRLPGETKAVESTTTEVITAPLLDQEAPMEANSTRQKMIAILQEFASNIATDKELARFAKGKNVVFTFTIKDLETTFFMSFNDGVVAAGLGQPPREADVRLKMSADTFDGIFTGRINATKAATSGKLSFSGDTGKAMSFIRIQGSMSRLYSKAREKVGDPGDLTNLSGVPPVLPSAPVPRLQEVGKVIKISDARTRILQVAHELYERGWITATGGNLSARCEDKSDQIWITPSSIFKGDLHAEMMIRLDLSGKILGDSEYTPSSEWRVHCAIYKQRPDIAAVIHTHAPYATMMALTGIPFLPISTEAAFIGDIPIVPFIMPGTDALGEAVARAIGAKGMAVLMQNHGLVVAGSSLRRAADMTEVIETTAQKIITCKLLGVEPPVLPPEVVQQLKEIGSMMA